jgi:hypothetical protein
MEGPTEEDAVLSIANGIWRKRRLQKFREAQVSRGRLNPDHTLLMMKLCVYSILTDKPDRFEDAISRLSPQKEAHLRRNFPRNKFKSTSEWVQAVQQEIKSVLLADANGYNDPPLVLLERSSRILSVDDVENELAVDERLDVMIERAIKRLIQTKTMKQLLERNSTVELAATPKASSKRTRGHSAPS